MEEECEMGRAATPLLTRAHANAATTRPIVAAGADNPAQRRAGGPTAEGEAAQAESRTWGSLSRARFLKLDGS